MPWHSFSSACSPSSWNICCNRSTWPSAAQGGWIPPPACPTLLPAVVRRPTCLSIRAETIPVRSPSRLLLVWLTRGFVLSRQAGRFVLLNGVHRTVDSAETYAAQKKLD